MQSYRELTVWQKSLALAIEVFKETEQLWKTDRSLSDQIRRSALSVPSNIAEGWARNSTKDFVHFLYIARGSLAELETQLTIARELGFAQKEYPQTEEVGKMLNSMISKLSARVTA